MLKNEMRLDFSAIPENEAFARMVISAFVMPLDPTVDEINDVKTAISEAVTNAIIHGYEGKGGTVRMAGRLDDNLLTVEVTDAGIGISNILQAREPLFTSKPDMERSGMGFTVMESFMDSIEVESNPGRGTTIRMKKAFGGNVGENEQ